MFATGPVPSPDCPAERPSVPAASCLWPSCCWARRVRTHPRACREAVAVRPREQPQAEVAQKSNSTAACWRLIYMSVHPLHLTTSHPIGSPTILTYITSQTHTHKGRSPALRCYNIEPVRFHAISFVVAPCHHAASPIFHFFRLRGKATLRMP